MTDYVPLFKPGQAVTRQASAAITGGQVVVVTGDGTVGPSAGASAAFFGVAATDAAVGDQVTVHKGGVQRPVASGAVTAGDEVVTAAAGRVSTLAAAAGATAGDINAARQVVGVALSTAADGETVDVDFVR